MSNEEALKREIRVLRAKMGAARGNDRIYWRDKLKRAQRKLRELRS